MITQKEGKLTLYYSVSVYKTVHHSLKRKHKQINDT